MKSLLAHFQICLIVTKSSELFSCCIKNKATFYAIIKENKLDEFTMTGCEERSSMLIYLCDDSKSDILRLKHYLNGYAK